MTNHFRKSFFYKGQRLFSYPLDTESEDAHLATVEALAYQQGCSPDEIDVYLEEFGLKHFDFSRDCIAESAGEHEGRERWRIMNVTNGKFHNHVGPLSEFIAKYEAGEL